MERLCGPFPPEMQDKSPLKRRFFDRQGKVRIDDLSRSSQNFVRNEAPCFEVSDFITIIHLDFDIITWLEMVL